MDVQAYILSGIVESYVLGLASPEEMAEFEQMASQHPEVLQARIAFELALEKQAVENAVPVPAAWENEIRNTVLRTNDVRADVHVPSASSAGQQARVVDMTQTPRSSGMLKYAAAAAVVALVTSLVWNGSLVNKNKELSEQIAAVNSQRDSAMARVGTIEDEMSVIKGQSDIKMTAMRGLEASPQSYATVYWDTTSHDVYLLANNLPTPASDKQYQLWAIFNGKPVDLGVFDVRQDRLLIKAKNAQGAEAFAITLEKKGGSAQPEGTMYVLGKL